jgi:small multidrug resistance pump
MAWLMLAISILFEISGTVFLKVSDGMARLWPAVGVGVCYTLSFWLFAVAVRRIDLAVGYAIWSAIGTAGIALISVSHFGESMSWIKIASLALIVAGVVGLNLHVSQEH